MNRKELTTAVAAKLEKIRRSLHYSTPVMADKLGLSRGSYKRNEKGETIPDTFSLYLFGCNLNISLDWLLRDRGPMYCPGTVPDRETGEKSPASHPVGSDVNELLTHMERIPLLHHEVMTVFHKFKTEHKDIVEEAMKS